MSHEIFAFKRGDPFLWPLWLHDADPDLGLAADDPARGVEIDNGVSFECQINSRHGEFVATMTYEAYEDQVTDKGWFLIKNIDPTDDWPVCPAVTDIKVIIDGVQKHSINFDFWIQEAQTP
ncbi:MAG: hypothetical protein VXW65_03605 [Pseudomonadota bacterium]|nr:hypothetical protein [Pseudomonadota bacterium]